MNLYNFLNRPWGAKMEISPAQWEEVKNSLDCGQRVFERVKYIRDRMESENYVPLMTLEQIFYKALRIHRCYVALFNRTEDEEADSYLELSAYLNTLIVQAFTPGGDLDNDGLAELFAALSIVDENGKVALHKLNVRESYNNGRIVIEYNPLNEEKAERFNNSLQSPFGTRGRSR